MRDQKYMKDSRCTNGHDIREKDQKKTFLGIKKNIFSRDQKKH